MLLCYHSDILSRDEPHSKTNNSRELSCPESLWILPPQKLIFLRILQTQSIFCLSDWQWVCHCGQLHIYRYFLNVQSLTVTFLFVCYLAFFFSPINSRYIFCLCNFLCSCVSIPVIFR